jgi:hypothetical protein
MKRLAAALAVLLAVGFSSCQCSDKPPVPPQKEEQATVMPDAAPQHAPLQDAPPQTTMPPTAMSQTTV